MWVGVIQLLLAVVAIWAFLTLFDNPGTIPNPAAPANPIPLSTIVGNDGSGMTLQLVIALIALGLYLLSVIINLFSWVRGTDAGDNN